MIVLLGSLNQAISGSLPGMALLSASKVACMLNLALLEQRAQEGMGELGLEAKPIGRDLLASTRLLCLWLPRHQATMHWLNLPTLQCMLSS